MLDQLKAQVCAQNKRLASSGLVISTWGNASARCPDTGYIIIKPSGVSYDEMTPEHMVVVDCSGKRVEGDLKPSSDLHIHLELYKQISTLGGIVHTHSTFATIWAQMGRSIPPFGTTHADDFYGDIPCSRGLTPEEIQGDYEKNTGKVIVETLALGQEEKDLHLVAEQIPAVLVKQHGPFVWDSTVEGAVTKAIVLEEVAKLGWHCISVGGGEVLSKPLMEKHFYRKHGKNAYYGQ